MKKILQWLAVAVFAILVFVPALAQAQTTSTPATDYYSALDRFLGVLIGGFLAFSGMYLNRKRD